MARGGARMCEGKVCDGNSERVPRLELLLARRSEAAFHQLQLTAYTSASILQMQMIQ